MTIQKIAFFYLVIPLFIFCATWFNFYTCTILLLSLFISCYFTKFSTELGDQPYILNKKTILLAFAIAFIWCFWSGIGGYAYQSDDFPTRNAIYRDLIEYSWPVNYNYNKVYSLNYYIGFWLLPSLITKFIGLFINNQDLLFTIGLNILLLHSIIGVTIFFLLLISYIKPKNNKQILLVLLLAVFFSGIDVIGAIIYDWPIFDSQNFKMKTFDYKILHLEVYSGYGKVQYSSLTTLLFWVFNQSIPAWIITLLVLKNKKPENYGIFITLGLFYSPLPLFGIAIIMLTNCILFLLNKELSLKYKLKNFISLSNIYIVPIFIVIATFISLNETGKHANLNFNVIIDDYLLFCLIEFGCYLFFIFFRYNKEPLFYVMTICLFTLCLFHIDMSMCDFQMRTTIPFLLLLMIYILQYLLNKPHFLCKLMLYLLLIIGACTPLIEFSRGIMQVSSSKSITHINDSWHSLGDKLPFFPYSNYLSRNKGNNKFYRLIAKH
ncbi:MAG: hypothetical protein IJZ30_06140 [Alphaproteobacteria bacterium]|nr:hypothetical protein [Alphaproteobacteria bacterium]